ncbi:MAG: ZirU family protein [Hafnia sp.]
MFNLNKISSSLFAGALSFAITTSAYAVVSVATPASVGHKPVASGNVTSTGALGPGQAVTLVDFGFTDTDGDLIDSTETMKTVQWYIMDGSTKTNLGAAGSAIATIPADATGKKLGLKYTIKTISGSPKEANAETDIILTVSNGGGVTGGGTDGELGRGAAVDPTTVAVTFTAAPTVEHNGTADAVPIAGVTELTAGLTCVAGTSCDDADFTYQWKVADAATPNTQTDVAGATSKTYKLEKTDQNKVFVVDVNVKSTVAPNP